MSYVYKTKGTCSMFIDIDMDGDTIKEVKFLGGCDGNLKAIANLVKGMKFEDVKDKLEGITCGLKSTSCGDQLVKGMEEAIKAQTSEA